MSKKKILVIGWDGADWKAIHPLIDKGLMPHTEKLINEGVMGNLATLDPPLSPMLWTSIATGKRPYKHGILGFTEPKADNSGIQPVLNTSRKCKAIWNILMQEQYKVHTIGWWPSHPAEPINGISISNFYQKANIPKDPSAFNNWAMMPSVVHPKEMHPLFAALRVHPYELTENHLHPFMPEGHLVDQKNPKFQGRMNSLRKTIADCSSIHSAASYILENEDWDFLGVYYDGIDHFGHGFMKFHPPHRPHIDKEMYQAFSHVVDAGYRFHDMMLGHLLSHTDEDTTVIILSDHGFHPDHMRPDFVPKIPAGPALEHNPLGVFIAKGPNIKKDQRIYGASLIDITPTILSIAGLPVARDMDGKPLTDIFQNSVDVNYIDSWETVDGDAGLHPEHLLKDSFVDKEAMDQLIELGYIEKPSEDTEKAITKTINECNYWLALSYIDGNKSSEALPLVEKLFYENTDQIRYGFTLANLYRSLNEVKKAKEVLGILKANSKLGGPNILVLEATILLVDDKPEQALESLLKAESLTKASPELLLHLGYTHMRLNQWNDAERVFHKCLQIEPANHHAYYGLGVTNYNLRDYKMAADNLIESISLIYYQPKAHLLLGNCLDKLGDNESALRAYQEVLKFETLEKKALTRMNQNLVNQNKTIEAEEARLQLVKMTEKEIVVVSGLPRSGTSMMMRMLEMGGIKPFTDNIRQADESNQRGYYEHEKIKSLHKDNSVLNDIKGEAVKIIVHLLNALPLKYSFKIIFMRRPIGEIVRSQENMLARLEKNPKRNQKAVAQSFKRMLQVFEKWSSRMPNVEVLDVKYNEALLDPEKTSKEIIEFLGDEYSLDIESMKQAVEKNLRREKINKQ
jgi:tetratricopeptide (TPR) repeat protein/predicted AlkP superfamily pyrophosphatase or phosphodiesterase